MVENEEDAAMKNNRGFSAVELLIAVAVFGIILIAATPIILTEFLAEQRANNGVPDPL